MSCWRTRGSEEMRTGTMRSRTRAFSSSDIMVSFANWSDWYQERLTRFLT